MRTDTAVPEVFLANGQGTNDAHTSGVSWGAVFAGATAAAALSLILLILGLGLGLSSISPWSYHANAISDSTIAWLTFMQLVASGVGGYIAGRLRVKWLSVHTDEVHFRDTAHGLLAWAVATLITVGVLAGGTHAILSGAAEVGAGTSALAGSARGQESGTTYNPMVYFSDMILRPNQTTALPDSDSTALRGEVNRILLIDLTLGKLTQDDSTYLGQLVARRQGISQADAVTRVNNIFAAALATRANVEEKAKEAAEKTRKAAAHSALWMFIALLFGAFVASLTATFGGKQRDSMIITTQN